MYFIFDSHSRSPQGLLSQSGLSTRILCSNVNELFVLIKRLASSMGFTNLVECNLTGARCISNTIDPIRKNPQFSREEVIPDPKVPNTVENDDEISVLHTDHGRLNFCQISESTKQKSCKTLGLPYSETKTGESIEKTLRELKKPSLTQKITGDGNCYFRAISFCLTRSESHHNAIRTAVCKHILRYENDFKTFLRSSDSTIQSHVPFMMQKRKLGN